MLALFILIATKQTTGITITSLQHKKLSSRVYKALHRMLCNRVIEVSEYQKYHVDS